MLRHILKNLNFNSSLACHKCSYQEGPAVLGLIVQWLTSNRLYIVILVIYPNISVNLVASCRKSDMATKSISLVKLSMTHSPSHTTLPHNKHKFVSLSSILVEYLKDIWL